MTQPVFLPAAYRVIWANGQVTLEHLTALVYMTPAMLRIETLYELQEPVSDPS